MRYLSLTLLCLTLIFSSQTFALHQAHLPSKFQSHKIIPVKRRLSVILPLGHIDQWIFLNKRKVLAGRLSLTIRSASNEQHIIIFNNGHFRNGWHAVTLGRAAKRNGINFKFISTKKYFTSPNDKLVLHYINKSNLQGFALGGITGLFQRGDYISHGRYSGLTDTPNLRKSQIAKTISALHVSKKRKHELLHSLDHLAFLANWQQQWPVKLHRYRKKY